MATPIHFIDGKCRMKYLKAGKSRKTRLTNRTRPISRHWLLMASGVDTHTHTYTDARTKAISRNQARGARLVKN